jgi:putative flippase GtrA
MKKDSSETAKQAGKFGLVGILNTVIDLGIFNLLSQVFGVYVVVANVVSVSAAIINSYIWNKNWTFQDKTKKNLLEQFAKFVIFSVFGMGIQTFMVWLLATKWTVTGLWAYSIVDLIGLEGIFSESFVLNNWAKVWGIGLALIWNFIAYKKWTFNKK